LPVVPTAQEISDRTIDTTTDGWDAPFLQEWAQKERYDQEVNGIRIGPSVAIESSACASREVEPLDADETLGTAMAISLAYVPSSARVEPDVNRMATGTAALACSDGTILANHVIVGIPAADDAVERIAQGESWFDVPHGGYVQISRMQLGAVDPPGVRTDIPASHWIDGQVAGHPAAIGKPVLDEGLGPAEVVIWDETTRILTFVHSYNVALTELIAIAEGVQ
jgi:hypothetical protein